MSPGRSHGRLLILVALVVMLFGQFVVTRLAPSEPYPAVLMPGFGAAPDSDGMFSFVVRSAEIHYADADPVTVTADQLFDGLAPNQMAPTWNRVFSDHSALFADPQALAWLRERATALSVNIASEPTELQVCVIDTTVDIETGLIRDEPCEITEVAL